MHRTLATVMVTLAVAATCVAADMPVLQQSTQQMIKSAPVGPTIAGPQGVNVIPVGRRTLAVLEITGNPVTGEIDIKQIPLIGEDGWPKTVPNQLFSQISKECSNCEMSAPLSEARHVTANLDLLPEPTVFICSANLQVASQSDTVVSVTNFQWAGVPLPADIAISGSTTSFTLDVTINNATRTWSVFVNVLGQVTTGECPNEGDLAFRLIWDGPADLDLWVFGPLAAGCANWIYYTNPDECDGLLDLDANYDCGEVTTYPLENTYWPFLGASAPSGTYQFKATMYEHCTGGVPPFPLVPFRIEVLRGGAVVDVRTGTLQNPLDQSTTWTYDYSP